MFMSFSTLTEPGLETCIGKAYDSSSTRHKLNAQWNMQIMDDLLKKLKKYGEVEEARESAKAKSFILYWTSWWDLHKNLLIECLDLLQIWCKMLSRIVEFNEIFHIRCKRKIYTLNFQWMKNKIWICGNKSIITFPTSFLPKSTNMMCSARCFSSSRSCFSNIRSSLIVLPLLVVPARGRLVITPCNQNK